MAATLWLREPQVLRANWRLLAMLATLEIARHVFARIKFGRAASYHCYLAKSWGLVMAIAVISALTTGGPHWLVWISLVFGIAADIEGLTMSLLLPRWQNDVKSLQVAFQFRRTMKNLS